MRILVFGKSGQVGSGLSKELAILGQVRCVGRETLDLTDLAAVEEVIQFERPDVIVNAAAYTHVDHAESDFETADLVNHKAPRVMAEMAATRQAWLVHYSTDYVFDGKAKVAYSEEDPICPVSVYGKTKADGEEAIKSSTDRYLILRTSWVYSNIGRNFLNTVLGLAQQQRELRIVDDQVGTPTFAGELSLKTVELLRQLSKDRDNMELSGVFNMTCQGSTTWYGFAAEIIRTAGIEGISLTPITTSEFPTAARRPEFSVLDNSKLKRVYNVALPEWQEALKICLAQRAFQ